LGLSVRLFAGGGRRMAGGTLMIGMGSTRRAVGSVVLAASMLLMLTGFDLGRAQAEDAAALIRTNLYAGTLQAGEAALSGLIAKSPDDPQARFGLGLVRFMRAIEHLGQSLYRYGLQPPAGVPILRMPVPLNPQPASLSYDGFRAILQDLVTDLQAADESLAAVGDQPVALTLDLSRIRLDITGDGARRDDERLWFIVSGAAPAATGGAGPDLTVTLDGAEVEWLRGYSHLLSAMAEWWLAHDFKLTFDEMFGVFFPRAGLRESFARDDDRARSGWTGFDLDLADAVTFIHLIRWPVVEPQRLARAREDLLGVIAASRASWKRILARTDDAAPRWIPGPGQKGIIQAFQVTPERVAAWLGLLDQAEDVLEGRKLVPYWRFVRGVNLKRVFTEPKTFDLVLWFTGPGARPFLDDGEMVSLETWNQMMAVFEGNFLTYAFWFN
jgi:hypothetical protein